MGKSKPVKHVAPPAKRSKPTPPAPVHCDTPVLQAYADWAQKRGFRISPKVEFTSSSVHGFGMRALEAIPKGEPIFRVPRSALISIENSRILDVLGDLFLMKKMMMTKKWTIAATMLAPPTSRQHHRNMKKVDGPPSS